ncbi:MAG: hypothetical protein AAF268_02790 [Cyanobacteria bacterium P01_A01_bin.3]
MCRLYVYHAMLGLATAFKRAIAKVITPANESRAAPIQPGTI